jgi:hypothetical protein
MDERPLDQAPAADPALDAVDRLLNGALLDMWTTADANRADAALIRAALADRITATMARELLSQTDDRKLSYGIRTRLGKIAEAGR